MESCWLPYIGNNVTIGGKSGVTKNIGDTNGAGFPAKDINLWKKEIIRNSIKNEIEQKQKELIPHRVYFYCRHM